MTESKIIKQKLSIDEILDKGIDAIEYERLAGIIAITGGEDNILYECNEQQAMILAVMEAIFYPRDPDGNLDKVVAYDDPVGYSTVKGIKLNMKSNKRKGLMETVKVLVGKPDEEEGLTGRIKDAVKGDD